VTLLGCAGRCIGGTQLQGETEFLAEKLPRYVFCTATPNSQYHGAGAHLPRARTKPGLFLLSHPAFLVPTIAVEEITHG
jgi:hypothetical protein